MARTSQCTRIAGFSKSMVLGVVAGLMLAAVSGGPHDTTPPADATGFTATVADSQVTLAWTNPGDADLAGVKILRKTGDSPTSPSDGKIAYNGAGQQIVDTGLLNGVMYYYAAFAYDKDNNFAAGVRAMALPTAATARAEILEEFGAVHDTVAASGIPASGLDALAQKLDDVETAYRGGLPCDAAATPASYYDGGALPADIRRGSGFPWNGTTADIISAFNAGRVLLIHRDHGWPGGWSSPSFNFSHVGSLNNGNLTPIIFSVNCASGLFDQETAGGALSTMPGGNYFAERLLTYSKGGAVGILGDTRNSPSWPNSSLLRGFVDAIWPASLQFFHTGTRITRLGDILNHGRLYMFGQIGVSGAGVSASDALDELRLWHCIGDPTLEFWHGYPYDTIMPELRDAQISGDSMDVGYDTDGATITALQQEPASGQWVPISRGTVKNGKATLPFINQPAAGLPVQLTASLPDAISKTVELTPTLGTPGS